MRLLETEFRRFWGRRLVWVSSGVMLAATVVGVLAGFILLRAEPYDEARQNEEAEALTARCVAQWMSYDLDRTELLRNSGADDGEVTEAAFERYLTEQEGRPCYTDPTELGLGLVATEILIDGGRPGVELFSDWSLQRPDTSVATINNDKPEPRRVAGVGLDGYLPTVATFYLVVATIIGASFVGAEYKAGTLENLLLWEPRRIRVLSSKFVAGFVSTTALTALLLAVLSAGLVTLAGFRGTTVAIDGRFWIDLASTVGRGALVGGLLFVAAMAISVLARNTTAAVGTILGWVIISSVAFEALLPVLRPWEIIHNATAFITESDAAGATIDDDADVYHHGYLTAGAVTAAWVAVLAAAATLSFARRDVD